MARSLAMIRKLTKISTSPMLLKDNVAKNSVRDDDEDDEAPNANDDILRMLPGDASLGDVEVSGKYAASSRQHFELTCR